MKLMTLKQYKKMSKTALMRKITKTLRAMPKAKLAMLCYNLTKAKLPRLSSIDPSLHTPKARKAREARVNKAVRQLQQDEKKYGVIKFRKALPKRKTKRKSRFKKGSPEAKRYMAKLRRMRK